MVWDQKPHEMCLQVVEERNDAQRQLSREQNAKILQDGILTSHLAKQKEIEMTNKEMNSEVFSLIIFKYLCVCICICIYFKNQYYTSQTV